MTAITRLMVANRGEIARRIFRTAHRMGIATVAIYADSDRNSPHVSEADTAIVLDGETYLDATKIIAAAHISGANALHPGYGFLSENADFAQSVLDAGLIWVGPSPASIRAIGDKLSAKAIARAAGIPTLEAHALTDHESPTQAAARIGYPILVKASAGGGGRGMRIVTHEADLPSAIESARREAQSAFGNGTLFLERYLQPARHIEVQILGDHHGTLVHLFERECSIQRRHQKIIEEAPSPAVSPDLRARLGAAALAAASRIQYHCAGTVEFLLAGDDFYFLEVNTRLQVEHPVTEAITGLDLVREQLRIAEGQPLGYTQQSLQITGHAIEARLCAEDPANDFLPAPGHIAVWRPAETPGIRIDSGIEQGSIIGTNFDPLIAKFIAHAPTRREAATLLARSLERTSLQGLTHNRDFLAATLRSPAFLKGDTTTDFLTRIAPAPTRTPSETEHHHACIAAALHARARRRATAKLLPTLQGSFRNSVMPPETILYRIGPATHTLTYRPRRDGSFAFTLNGTAITAHIETTTETTITLTIASQRHAFTLVTTGPTIHLHGPHGDLDLTELPRFPPPATTEATGGVRAPMPGRVLALHATQGQHVTSGDLLLILEAMKMEHRITAPTSGTITTLHVALGDQVPNGATLVIIEPTES